jgi:hypothetical protein
VKVGLYRALLRWETDIDTYMLEVEWQKSECGGKHAGGALKAHVQI